LIFEKEHIEIDTEIQQLVTTGQAWHYFIVPKSSQNGKMIFYIDKTKSNQYVKDELEVLFGTDIELIAEEPELIIRTLGKYYRRNNRKTVVENSGQNNDDFLYKLIEEANYLECSDIHVEAYDESCRVRFRIDGKLIEKYMLSKEDYPVLINKIKIKADIDIAEKRLPQDGRIFFQSLDTKFDIRVSVLPTLHGEKVVMRLLSKDATMIDINVLGFDKPQLESYIEGISKPHGIVLISGPTGSGKTTTLYATLKILNDHKSNILTIEDPIEYTLDGINQVQLKENIGLTFARALRTFLRQDPDIIMLGEIRDNETAQMAIRAALTGHLVLSTIHTNSAWGTISRLADMDVPPFLIAETMNLSVAQRLVRILCPRCKRELDFDQRSFPRNFTPPEKIERHYESVGCESCFYTGYKGRKAVYEVIPINYYLSEKIKSRELDIRQYMKENNIKSLSDSAFELFKNGQTTIKEIYPILINNI